jgi:hypothetical protein
MYDKKRIIVEKQHCRYVFEVLFDDEIPFAVEGGYEGDYKRTSIKNLAAYKSAEKAYQAIKTHCEFLARYGWKVTEFDFSPREEWESVFS